MLAERAAGEPEILAFLKRGEIVLGIDIARAKLKRGLQLNGGCFLHAASRIDDTHVVRRGRVSLLQ